jgi:hypothetical protein
MSAIYSIYIYILIEYFMRLITKKGRNFFLFTYYFLSRIISYFIWRLNTHLYKKNMNMSIILYRTDHISLYNKKVNQNITFIVNHIVVHLFYFSSNTFSIPLIKYCLKRKRKMAYVYIHYYCV